MPHFTKCLGKNISKVREKPGQHGILKKSQGKIKKDQKLDETIKVIF